ncbi:MAG: hypothetical protein HY904_10800 [Deltaproteobacteria bacterium]|nr:hypothetical protein [Deltaproteobacteria bacterium]
MRSYNISSASNLGALLGTVAVAGLGCKAPLPRCNTSADCNEAAGHVCNAGRCEPGSPDAGPSGADGGVPDAGINCSWAGNAEQIAALDGKPETLQANGKAVTPRRYYEPLTLYRHSQEVLRVVGQPGRYQPLQFVSVNTALRPSTVDIIELPISGNLVATQARDGDATMLVSNATAIGAAPASSAGAPSSSAGAPSSGAGASSGGGASSAAPASSAAVPASSASGTGSSSGGVAVTYKYWLEMLRLPSADTFLPADVGRIRVTPPDEYIDSVKRGVLDENAAEVYAMALQVEEKHRTTEGTLQDWYHAAAGTYSEGATLRTPRILDPGTAQLSKDVTGVLGVSRAGGLLHALVGTNQAGTSPAAIFSHDPAVATSTIQEHRVADTGYFLAVQDVQDATGTTEVRVAMVVVLDSGARHVLRVGKLAASQLASLDPAQDLTVAAEFTGAGMETLPSGDGHWDGDSFLWLGHPSTLATVQDGANFVWALADGTLKVRTKLFAGSSALVSASVLLHRTLGTDGASFDVVWTDFVPADGSTPAYEALFFNQLQCRR